MQLTNLGKTIAYLSGAPRVSTHPDASASGPRSHVLGVIKGFESLGWVVKSFIAGDHVPESWVVGNQSEQKLESSYLNRLAADFVRLGLGWVNSLKVSRNFQNVDLCYERYGVFQALGRALQKKGIPWVLETNGLIFVEASEDRHSIALVYLAQLWERWAYRTCDVLICTSPSLAELIVKELSIDSQKIVIMPVAADIERLNPKLYTPRRFFQEPTIGFVGSFYPWQAVDVLIRAVADLSSQGLKYKLVLVGDGPEKAAWEDLVNDFGLSSEVKFIGRVPFGDVPNYIKGFDLGYSGQIPLKAGVMYGSPSKIYEYMAMECPVIASTCFEDALNLILDDETGYSFVGGSIDSLKVALKRAFDRKENWRKMGENARNLVLTHHTWEARVRKALLDSQTILDRKEKQ